jgi:putative membrane protein
MGMFGMFFGGLLFLALLVGGIALIVWMVRRLSAGTPVHTPARSATARQILDERYARGEISREEYLTALADIERGSSAR